jgi:hypothetical protein
MLTVNSLIDLHLLGHLLTSVAAFANATASLFEAALMNGVLRSFQDAAACLLMDRDWWRRVACDVSTICLPLYDIRCNC